MVTLLLKKLAGRSHTHGNNLQGQLSDHLQCDFENEGQGHGIKHSQWCRSMANNKIYTHIH